MNKKKKNIITAIALVLFMIFLFALTFYNIGIYNRDNLMNFNKKKLTPIVLVSIFFLMLALSFAAVPFTIYSAELLVWQVPLKMP